MYIILYFCPCPYIILLYRSVYTIMWAVIFSLCKTRDRQVQVPRYIIYYNAWIFFYYCYYYYFLLFLVIVFQSSLPLLLLLLLLLQIGNQQYIGICDRVPTTTKLYNSTYLCLQLYVHYYNKRMCTYILQTMRSVLMRCILR